MSKVTFIKVKGYEHYYCQVVDGGHEIKVNPIIGMYVDRKHSAISVLDIHGVICPLANYPTVYNAMKSPDGVFSFCGCWFEDQDAWQEFIRRDQAEAAQVKSVHELGDSCAADYYGSPLQSGTIHKTPVVKTKRNK